MASKQPTQPASRKERRAADRQQDRFEAARVDRKASSRASSKPSGVLNARTITLGAVLLGVLIVVVVASQQLSLGTTIKDPGLAYPASIQHDNALGDPAAPVTVDVYSDFQCPFCARFALDTEPALVGKYVTTGKARIVHHDFEWVAQNVDRESRLAAAGGLCAVQQAKYWAYNHWLFANQLGENVGSFTRDRLLKIAAAAGLDAGALGTCLDKADVLAQVDANTASFVPIAQAHGGTPTIMIDGVAATSPTVDALSKLIDAALAGGAGSAAPSASGNP